MYTQDQSRNDHYSSAKDAMNWSGSNSEETPTMPPELSMLDIPKEMAKKCDQA